jgi:hypothetical protein
MSRAFHPPDTLSKDDIRTIANVRREIWTNAMKGLAVGTLTGFTGYAVASIGHYRFKLWKLSPKALNRNTAILSVLLGGAIGSFVMSVTTGKNQVHHLHPIFSIGSNQNKEENEDETISTHLTLKELAILQQQEQERQHSMDHTVDRAQLEQNRLYRRATLTKKMEVQGNRFNQNSNIPATTEPSIGEVDGQLLSDHEVSKALTQKQQR